MNHKLDSSYSETITQELSNFIKEGIIIHLTFFPLISL